MKRSNIALAAALTLGACSTPTSDDEAATPTDTPVTLTFRLWDSSAVPAYRQSFEDFTAENPNVTVEIEVVEEDDYWSRVDADLGSGTMADVFWLNPATVVNLHRRDSLVPIDTRPDDWETALVELFTVEEGLWAVPQMWSSVALYYDRELFTDVDLRSEALTWAPDGGEGDTLIAAATELTVDENGRNAADDNFDPDSVVRYGFAADPDIRTAFIPFIHQAGGQFQDADGRFAFATDEGEQATQYLVDLIHEHGVSPSIDVADDEQLPALFADGEIALYQSDSDILSFIAREAEIDWAIAPIVGGPEGKISSLDGVAAAGNADSDHPEATALLLEWLGTAKGQEPLAAHGLAFPGNLRAQDTYVNHWAKQGVDVSVFIESSRHAITVSAHDLDIQPALEEIRSMRHRILAGEVPVAEGLQQAQRAGNDALGG